LKTLLELALVLGAAAALLSTYRLMKGPGAASRAVAMDVLTLITMPMMAGLALWMHRAIYVDVALVYAILSFLGVTALARYADRGV
jgi:multicomponent Na+:H+ antiporter subunit F